MSKKSKKKHSTPARQAVSKPQPAFQPLPPKPVGSVPCRPKGSGYKTAALTIGMVSALGLGAWLLVSPTLTQQRMLARQEELLASIVSGDGMIALEEQFAAEEVDFYDDGADAPQEEAAAMRPVMYTVADAEAPATAPAPGKTSVAGVGVLFIDSIGLRLPVTDGVTTAQLKVAVGRVPQTAPIGGIGNAVIAGHRSYTYGQFFNRLGEVAEGDVIRYEDKGGAAYAYKVFEILEVQPGEPRAFEQPKDDSILTLYTCTPIRTATHRLLVRARLISQIQLEEESH